MTKLPGLHVCLGLIVFGLSAVAKDDLPQNIGSLPIIQLPCAFFSSVMIPLGSLLALKELVMGSGNRRKLVSYHLVGLLFVLVMLSVYFAEVIVMDKVMEIAQFPSVLPKLVENARSFPDQQKRISQAKWAYRMYGVTIAYQVDDQRVVYYEPTAEDIAAHNESERSSRAALVQIAFIKKVTSQFPYLFGLYAATFTTTFVIGWVWLVLRLPKDQPTATS